jgi:hypothetical protein
MSGKSKCIVDRRPPRVDRERLMKGPTAADLRELPATTAADWQKAELLIPIDEATDREFELFRAKRRKRLAKA